MKNRILFILANGGIKYFKDKVSVVKYIQKGIFQKGWMFGCDS